MGDLIAGTRVVLVRPSLPANIGSVARAMRHFGLRELVLVGEGYPMHPDAIALAAGAADVLRTARVVPDLAAALAGVVCAIATTARPYESKDLRSVEVREAAAIASRAGSSGGIALVFGTERHGLTVEDLRRCHHTARIPGEDGTCLNLAMAVNIFAYEWYLADRGEPTEELAAGAVLVAEEPGLGSALEAILRQSGVLRGHDAEAKAHTIRRMLGRVPVTRDEAALLRAIAHGLARAIGKD